eukprot:TRINITY_DN10090_c0_g1_i1.p1 TRINITY_DN10090_c0_g1~~TRINITY_DN10090_c0_g1_i1.p1  ORF type:complete len:375 (+),score=52.12 TRINITY_DN10090_c0_g1_i1:204-1328(+)
MAKATAATKQGGSKRRRGLGEADQNMRLAKRKKTGLHSSKIAKRKPVPQKAVVSSLFATNLMPVVPMNSDNDIELKMLDFSEEDEEELESSPALDLVRLPRGVVAIDEFDRDDPQQCLEIVDEILDYLRFKEGLESERPDPDYMIRQLVVRESMRGILVDWMFSVCIRYSFLSETLFLAVSLLDRFLSRRLNVGKTKLQLVGLGCLLIAAKFEEILTPCIDDFLYISNNAYSRSEILKIEATILSQLEWNISYPNPLHFLRRFSKAARSDLYDHTLSKYISEVSMCSYKLLQFKPSIIAAASVYLSRKMMKYDPCWDTTLVHYTKVTEEDLITCARTLNTIISSPVDNRNTRTVRAKYGNERFHNVAATPTVQF